MFVVHTASSTIPNLVEALLTPIKFVQMRNLSTSAEMHFSIADIEYDKRDMCYNHKNVC